MNLRGVTQKFKLCYFSEEVFICLVIMILSRILRTSHESMLIFSAFTLYSFRKIISQVMSYFEEVTVWKRSCKSL
jgi:hypothetical protein